MDEKKEAQNCWEFWNCSKENIKKCLAYKLKMGRECWMISGKFTPGKNHAPLEKRNFKYCFDCPWYKRLNPDS